MLGFERVAATQLVVGVGRGVDDWKSFNAMVSHDLRGPLSGIARLSELLQEDLRRGETANLRPWLAMVETQILRLATLAEDPRPASASTRSASVSCANWTWTAA